MTPPCQPLMEMIIMGLINPHNKQKSKHPTEWEIILTKASAINMLFSNDRVLLRGCRLSYPIDFH